jgi:methyltransferase-like protein 6
MDKRHWDLFYKRNSQNFFKDRHWTSQEFPEVFQVCSLLEIGCGVGNFLIPLNLTCQVHCCDLSPRAIDFLAQKSTFNCFVCDVTSQPLTEFMPKVDMIAAIFVFSAIPPNLFESALLNAKSVLNPGGLLVLRDYGDGDCAQKRFKQENFRGDHYVRHDGTLSVFFTLEYLERVFTDLGFEIVECKYVHRQISNRKLEITMDRVFVQGKFRLLE